MWYTIPIIKRKQGKIKMNFTVTAQEAGMTVKEYLRRRSVSATCLRTLKQKENGITRNGTHCTVRAVLQEGDCLCIAVEDHMTTDRTPLTASQTVPILYEDDDVLVVDKPWGMPTHQSHGHRGDTLSDVVLSMPNAPTVFRAVNRLDADTSGVVLLARNRLAANFLCARMAAGEIQKEYLAIVEKTPASPSGKMIDYIAREGESIIRRVTVAEGEGDYAEADYETVSVHGAYTLLRLLPKTGRTHQLRVQLSSRGMPIVGDDFYGGSTALARQALHAARLTFPHPNGSVITVKSDLPRDMLEILKKETP